MVDQSNRTLCLSILHQLLAEGISTYEIEDKWPEVSDDPAIAAISGQMWHYYDDFPERRLGSKDLTDEVIQMIERCILFLESGQEYKWPVYSFETRNLKWFRRVFDFNGRKTREEWERFCSAGDPTVWRFLCRSDYNSVWEDKWSAL